MRPFALLCAFSIGTGRPKRLIRWLSIKYRLRDRERERSRVTKSLSRPCAVKRIPFHGMNLFYSSLMAWNWTLDVALLRVWLNWGFKSKQCTFSFRFAPPPVNIPRIFPPQWFPSDRRREANLKCEWSTANTSGNWNYQSVSHSILLRFKISTRFAYLSTLTAHQLSYSQSL